MRRDPAGVQVTEVHADPGGNPRGLRLKLAPVGDYLTYVLREAVDALYKCIILDPKHVEAELLLASLLLLGAALWRTETKPGTPGRAPERSSALPAGTSPKIVMQIASAPRVVSPPTSSVA